MHSRPILKTFYQQKGRKIDALVGIVPERVLLRVLLDPDQRLIESVTAKQELALDEQFLGAFVERQQRNRVAKAVESPSDVRSRPHIEA